MRHYPPHFVFVTVRTEYPSNPCPAVRTFILYFKSGNLLEVFVLTLVMTVASVGFYGSLTPAMRVTKKLLLYGRMAFFECEILSPTLLTPHFYTDPISSWEVQNPSVTLCKCPHRHEGPDSGESPRRGMWHCIR